MSTDPSDAEVPAEPRDPDAEEDDPQAEEPVVTGGVVGGEQDPGDLDGRAPGAQHTNLIPLGLARAAVLRASRRHPAQ